MAASQAAGQEPNGLLCFCIGGGGANLYHRSYNGKPVPPEFQGPDYITYAGATIKKEFHPFETYLSKTIGAMAT